MLVAPYAVDPLLVGYVNADTQSTSSSIGVFRKGFPTANYAVWSGMGFGDICADRTSGRVLPRLGKVEVSHTKDS